MIAIVYYVLEDYKFQIDFILERLIYNLKRLGATHFFIVDQTQFGYVKSYQNGDGEIAFEVFNNLNEIKGKYPDVECVCLENLQTIKKHNREYKSLSDFTHPKSCIYIVGSDRPNSTNILSETKDICVNISELEDCWAEFALTICLYDRKAKE